MMTAMSGPAREAEITISANAVSAKLSVRGRTSVGLTLANEAVNWIMATAIPSRQGVAVKVTRVRLGGATKSARATLRPAIVVQRHLPNNLNRRRKTPVSDREARRVRSRRIRKTSLDLEVRRVRSRKIRKYSLDLEVRRVSSRKIWKYSLDLEVKGEIKER
jgi:hypothetical protein